MVCQADLYWEHCVWRHQGERGEKRQCALEWRRAEVDSEQERGLIGNDELTTGWGDCAGL